MNGINLGRLEHPLRATLFTVGPSALLSANGIIIFSE